ncbi:hypothetical protein ACFWPQ_38145 [Streptomyces sp. NPDC058464]|uniref:hypothetical protein n=1 Tax=Streptomyces sp. NPDC058464 TaxID=3346511 RepID=UPI003665AED9
MSFTAATPRRGAWSPYSEAYAAGLAGMCQAYSDALRPLRDGSPDAPHPTDLASALFGMALGVNAQYHFDSGLDREAACDTIEALARFGLGVR